MENRNGLDEVRPLMTPKRKQTISEARDSLDWLEPGIATRNDQDIEELPVLLGPDEVRALIVAAHSEGLSAAGLVRHLIRDYLLWLRSDFGRALQLKLKGLAPGEAQ